MNARKKLAVTLAILFILSFIVYSGFEAEKLIYGPQILLTSPKNNDTVQGPGLIKIIGTVKNVSFLSLDGRQIFTDTNGNFNEDLVLLPGYNIITLVATGRYGKEISKKIQIYLVKDLINSFVATSTQTNFAPQNLTGQAATTSTSTKSSLPAGTSTISTNTKKL